MCTNGLPGHVMLSILSCWDTGSGSAVVTPMVHNGEVTSGRQSGPAVRKYSVLHPNHAALSFQSNLHRNHSGLCQSEGLRLPTYSSIAPCTTQRLNIMIYYFNVRRNKKILYLRKHILPNILLG